MGKSENKYQAVDEPKASEKSKPKEKKRRTTNRSTKKPKKSSRKLNLLKPITDLFAVENRKLNLTLGSILLLLSIYLILQLFTYNFK